MKKALIIVESPTKIKTLKKILKGYDFTSSLGHIRDLPSKDFGIDTENDFDPTYFVLPEKEDTVKNLKKIAKDYETVYLAPDPDREGEAIATVDGHASILSFILQIVDIIIMHFGSHKIT